MSFMYPRTISISRPAENVAAGDQGYATAAPADEASIETGIAASIQQRRSGGQNSVGLPGDARVTSHRIFFRWPTPDLVKKRDIITDDLGIRYQVDSPYWNSLGFRLECIELEA